MPLHFLAPHFQPYTYTFWVTNLQTPSLSLLQGTIMKIRSMQTCIMSSLPHCIFRCSVFRYVTLVSFFFFSFFLIKLCYLIVTLLLWWRINTYLLTYLLTKFILHQPNYFLVLTNWKRSVGGVTTRIESRFNIFSYVLIEILSLYIINI